MGPLQARGKTGSFMRCSVQLLALRPRSWCQHRLRMSNIYSSVSYYIDTSATKYVTKLANRINKRCDISVKTSYIKGITRQFSDLLCVVLVSRMLGLSIANGSCFIALIQRLKAPRNWLECEIEGSQTRGKHRLTS